MSTHSLVPFLIVLLLLPHVGHLIALIDFGGRLCLFLAVDPYSLLLPEHALLTTPASLSPSVL